jgi:hypothetical protein
MTNDQPVLVPQGIAELPLNKIPHPMIFVDENQVLHQTHDYMADDQLWRIIPTTGVVGKILAMGIDPRNPKHSALLYTEVGIYLADDIDAEVPVWRRID